ncbi:MAG: Wzz/FepE/Etk N-terminal domain-containing protein [Tissierella sp.]|uniref:Wzz/FepE/Etk N-terminal domain-containing protein n=1 Tax=Tissierella sp. TaxID=41274 RepID=UPI003F9C8914
MNDNVEIITLSEVVRVVRKRKKLIGALIIGFLIIGMLQSFVFTDTKYESEILLEINNIESTSEESVSDNDEIYNMLEKMSHSSDMDFETYLKELTSERVLEETIKDLSLEDTYTVDSLKKDLSIEADSKLKNISLKLVSDDSKQGDKILDVLAENYVNHITKIAQESSLHTLDIVKKQMEIEKGKYETALSEYEDVTSGVKSSYELELEKDATYHQLTEYKLNLNNLNIKKEGILGAIEKNENMGTNNGSMIVRPGGRDGYIYIDTTKRALKADLAETNAKIKSTKSSIEELQDTVKTLQIEYQDVEFIESSARKKVELTKTSYDAFAHKYQELDMANSMNIGEISVNIVSDTQSSDDVVGRSVLNKLTISIILGIMAGLVLSLFLEYLEVMKIKRHK